MSKNLMKELIILLLIILAIILVLGVVLYGFLPNNKVIPEEIIYTTSTTVKEALQNATGVNEEDVIRTYSIDSTDLNNFQATNDYRPGKTNPFSSYIVKPAEGSDGENDNVSTGGGSSGNRGSSGVGTSSGGSTNTIDRSKPIAPGEVNPGNYTNNKGLK